MSCDACAKETSTRNVATPIRVGTSTVDVYGCEEHVRMLLDVVRAAYRDHRGKA